MPKPEGLTRREFFGSLVGLGILFLLPEKELVLEFGDLVRLSDRFEPQRVYPLEHSFRDVPYLYEMPGGKVSFVTEEELLGQLQKVVMRTDKNSFLSFDESRPIPYRVQKTINLDPHLWGDKFHWGMDFDSAQPESGTLVTTAFLSRFVLWEFWRGPGRTLPRLGPDALVTQLIDKNGQDIVVNLWGKKFFVFALYGHIRLTHGDLAVGQILPVGSVIGDITRVSLPETPAHTHLEMILIPADTALNATTIHELLIREEDDPRVANVYLDSSIFWKFLPGNLKENIGKTQMYFDVTANYQERIKYE